jgi:hypothetical protein
LASLDLRVFIRATPDRLWRIISDLSGQQRWMVDVRRLDIVSETKSGVGTVLDLTSELFGLPVVHDVMEIVSWEEPREIGVVHRGQFTGTAHFRLEPVRGGTVFVWHEEFRPPLGLLGEIGHALIVKPHLERVFVRSMENVRRLAEDHSL